MLEGQLESARRDLRSSQRTTARLEEELTAAAEAAAGREMSLNTQVGQALLKDTPSSLG
jgi:predicted HicB family RNase H-like nuclease